MIRVQVTSLEQFGENHTKQEKPDHDDYIHTYFIGFPPRGFSKDNNSNLNKNNNKSKMATIKIYFKVGLRLLTLRIRPSDRVRGCRAAQFLQKPHNPAQYGKIWLKI